MSFRAKKQDKSLFFLFSSDSSPRYQRNVLDILCYPENHIFRFRYQDKYVSDEIKAWERSPIEINEKLKAHGGRGIVIYAETTDNSPRDFNFYPVREVKIASIKVEGFIYYVDIILGKFINYFAGLDDLSLQDENVRVEKGKENLKIFRDQIKSHKFYPLPKLNETGDSFVWDEISKDIKTLPPGSSLENKTQGFYFNLIKETENNIPPLDYVTKEHFSNSSWESVIDVISRAEKMKSSVFYRILGFYPLPFFGIDNFGKDRNIKIQNKALTTTYLLPMGETVTLKLLFYKSEQAWEENPEIKNQILEIKSNSDVFAGFSQTEIPILSRYNEELIQIACKRVFDSVFAPISIQLKKKDDKKDTDSTEKTTNKEILAPQPYLVTKISVPAWVKIRLIAYTVLASVLLSFSPDVFKYLGETSYLKQNYTFFSETLINNAGWITAFFKTAGALFTLAAAYLAFRKLPVGGK